MTRSVRYRPSAERDITDLLQYLDAHTPRVADQFAIALTTTVHRLVDWPLSAPQQRFADQPLLSDVHVSPVSRVFHRYLVFYRPFDDGIIVLRVLHGSRDIPTLLLESDTPPSWQRSGHAAIGPVRI